MLTSRNPTRLPEGTERWNRDIFAPAYCWTPRVPAGRSPARKELRMTLTFTKLPKAADAHKEILGEMQRLNAPPHPGPLRHGGDRVWPGIVLGFTQRWERYLETYESEEGAFLEWVDAKQKTVKGLMKHLGDYLKKFDDKSVANIQVVQRDLTALVQELSQNRQGLKAHFDFRENMDLAPGKYDIPEDFLDWYNGVFMPRRQKYIDALKVSLTTEAKIKTTYPQRAAEVLEAAQRIQEERAGSLRYLVKVYDELVDIQEKLKTFLSNSNDVYWAYKTRRDSYDGMVAGFLRGENKLGQSNEKILSSCQERAGDVLQKLKLVKAAAKSLETKYQGLKEVILKCRDEQNIDKKLVPGLEQPLQKLRDELRNDEAKFNDISRQNNEKLKKVWGGKKAKK
jgi:hypothetical protein